jgi:NADPH-dependent 2,4-dienoyl-CoA reductase/sulfur reductase-like enzyme/rhodanese-related sulfurtransferase
MSKKIVIIGGVAAGPKAACRIKRLLSDAEVTIIDQDSIISYGGCGIPYYVSGDVSDEKELRTTSFHAVRDEAFFANAKGVNVKASTRALSINRKDKTVEVQDLTTGNKESIAYDKLVLTTGSTPNRLNIPGADLDGIYTATDMHQAVAIKDDMAKGRVGRAVVIGGGAIGIEMAEAFADLWGVETSIVEYMDQLLPRIMDWPMAAMLANHLEEKGVRVYTSESATSFEGDENGRVCRVVTRQRTIETDIVLMAVGVRPRDELARQAGLLVAERGGIVVNNRMQTSDPDIYAAGDCVEITNLLSGTKNHAPMGSLANRQGRVAADNIAGLASRFDGWVGSFIMKAFDCCVGGTGLSLETALAEGFDADVAITAQSDRAHFFPDQAIIILQMVFDRTTRKVLGLQGYGPANDGILARINAAAGLLAKGATIEDFSVLEMAYAPPFATAVDALNATANVADNMAADLMRTVSIEEFLVWMDDMSTVEEWVVLDVRHPQEAAPYVEKYGDLWKAVRYEEVRQLAEKELADVPADKQFIIICNAGTRSFEVQLFLDTIDRDSLVLGGGFNAIKRIGPDWWIS